MASRLAEDTSVGTVVRLTGATKPSGTQGVSRQWLLQGSVHTGSFQRTGNCRMFWGNFDRAANSNYALDAGSSMSATAPLTAEVHAAESLRHARLAGLCQTALASIAVEFVLEGLVDRDALGDALMDAALDRILTERRDDPSLRQAAAERRAERGED